MSVQALPLSHACVSGRNSSGGKSSYSTSEHLEASTSCVGRLSWGSRVDRALQQLHRGDRKVEARLAIIFSEKRSSELIIAHGPYLCICMYVCVCLLFLVCVCVLLALGQFRIKYCPRLRQVVV